MRAVVGVLWAGLVLAGCGSPEAARPSGEAIPARAPGLWRETVTTDGTTQVQRFCLDRAAARRLNLVGDELAPFACDVDRQWRTGDGWGYEYRCDMSSYGRQHHRGAARGDLATWFSLQETAVVEDAEFPKANGRHETTIEARHEGPCPAGMRGGDVLLDNGERFNVLNTRPMR